MWRKEPRVVVMNVTTTKERDFYRSGLQLMKLKYLGDFHYKKKIKSMEQSSS
jgi:hypothetical protein